MELGFQNLGRLWSQSLFQKPTRITTRRACEAFGFHGGLTAGQNGDFDKLQAAPPT